MPRPIEYFARAVARQDDAVMTTIANQLRSSPRAGHGALGDWLLGFVNSYSGQKAGTYAHCALALSWWLTADGIRMEEGASANPFHVARFVRGRPKGETQLMFRGELMGGSYDSVFIADSGAEDPAQAMYLEFVNQVIDAMKDYAEDEYRAGRPEPMPLYLNLDELFRAPLPGLPDWLADFRARGICVDGGAQDTDQLEQVYKLRRVGDVMAKFGTFVNYRGMTNAQALQDLSDLTARQKIQLHASSEHRDHRGRIEWSPSVSEQVLPLMTPDQIGMGHPNPQIPMMFHPNNHWNWVHGARYFEHEWAAVLVNSCTHAINAGSDLPLPPLAKDGNYSNLAELGLDEHFRKLQYLHQTGELDD